MDQVQGPKRDNANFFNPEVHPDQLWAEEGESSTMQGIAQQAKQDELYSVKKGKPSKSQSATLEAINAKLTGATSDHKSTDAVRVLLVSSAINDPLSLGTDESQELANAARAKGTLVIQYDAAKDSLDKLLRLISMTLAEKGLRSADSIAFATHGHEGEFLLTDTVKVSDETLHANRGNNPVYTFFEELQSMIKPNGRLDLLGCNIANNEKGKTLIEDLERITGVPVGASTDITGSGGDWVLETAGNIDISGLYFDKELLSKWNSRLLDSLVVSVNNILNSTFSPSTLSQPTSLSINLTPSLPAETTTIDALANIPTVIALNANNPPGAGSMTVSITTLPDQGLLYQFDGTPITLPNTIVTDPNFRVRYDNNGTSSNFTYEVSRTPEEGQTISSDDATVNININTEASVAEETVQVYQNSHSIIRLSGDSGYVITSLPEKGLLYQYDATKPSNRGNLIAINDAVSDSTGRIVYTSPIEIPIGNVSFNYTGDTSTQASISVAVQQFPIPLLSFLSKSRVQKILADPSVTEKTLQAIITILLQLIKLYNFFLSLSQQQQENVAVQEKISNLATNLAAVADRVALAINNIEKYLPKIPLYSLLLSGNRPPSPFNTSLTAYVKPFIVPDPDPAPPPVQSTQTPLIIPLSEGNTNALTSDKYVISTLPNSAYGTLHIYDPDSVSHVGDQIVPTMTDVSESLLGGSVVVVYVPVVSATDPTSQNNSFQFATSRETTVNGSSLIIPSSVEQGFITINALSTASLATVSSGTIEANVYQDSPSVIQLAGSTSSADPVSFTIGPLTGMLGTLSQYDQTLITTDNRLVTDSLGRVIYTPPSFVFGNDADSFSYTATAGAVTTTSSTVNLNIASLQVPPIIASTTSTFYSGIPELLPIYNTISSEQNINVKITSLPTTGTLYNVLPGSINQMGSPINSGEIINLSNGGVVYKPSSDPSTVDSTVFFTVSPVIDPMPELLGESATIFMKIASVSTGNSTVIPDSATIGTYEANVALIPISGSTLSNDQQYVRISKIPDPDVAELFYTNAAGVLTAITTNDTLITNVNNLQNIVLFIPKNTDLSGGANLNSSFEYKVSLNPAADFSSISETGLVALNIKTLLSNENVVTADNVVTPSFVQVLSGGTLQEGIITASTSTTATVLQGSTSTDTVWSNSGQQLLTGSIIGELINLTIESIPKPTPIVSSNQSNNENSQSLAQVLRTIHKFLIAFGSVGKGQKVKVTSSETAGSHILTTTGADLAKLTALLIAQNPNGLTGFTSSFNELLKDITNSDIPSSSKQEISQLIALIDTLKDQPPPPIAKKPLDEAFSSLKTQQPTQQPIALLKTPVNSTVVPKNTIPKNSVPKNTVPENPIAKTPAKVPTIPIFGIDEDVITPSSQDDTRTRPDKSSTPITTNNLALATDSPTVVVPTINFFALPLDTQQNLTTIHAVARQLEVINSFRQVSAIQASYQNLQNIHKYTNAKEDNNKDDEDSNKSNYN